MQPFKKNMACMSNNNLFNKKTQKNKTVQLQSITKPHKTMWVIFKLVFCVLLWFVTKIRLGQMEVFWEIAYLLF